MYYSYNKTICFLAGVKIYLLKKRQFSSETNDLEPSLKLLTSDKIFHKEKQRFFKQIALRHYFLQFVQFRSIPKEVSKKTHQKITQK